MERFFASVSGREYEIVLESSGTIRVDGKRVDLECHPIAASVHGIVLGGRSMRLASCGVDSQFTIIVDGTTVQVSVESSRDRLLRAHRTSATRTGETLEVRAPMPALVVSVEVVVGEVVRPGQGLLLLEAMKMENEIRAHASGTISEILVEKGKTVEKGELLLRFR